MDDIQKRIEQLEAEIAQLDRTALELEAELAEVERELEEFEQRYARVVGSVAARVEAARAAVDDLEHRIQLKHWGYESPPETSWNVPPPHTGPSAYNTPSRTDPAPSAPRGPAEQSRNERLKTLYRLLALRFHPDLARDQRDSDERTRLMAMINEAYANGDLEALIQLQQSGVLIGSDANIPGRATVTFSVLRVRELEQKRDDLLARIADQKAQRDSLAYSEMMALKIEDSLARAKGRDLLREIADRMEKEYGAFMQRLNELRQRL